MFSGEEDSRETLAVLLFPIYLYLYLGSRCGNAQSSDVRNSRCGMIKLVSAMLYCNVCVLWSTKQQK